MIRFFPEYPLLFHVLKFRKTQWNSRYVFRIVLFWMTEYHGMKIALTEIWDFLLLTEKEEKGWSYALNAGKVQIKNITLEMMQELKKDENFDTELLPSLFTFREILWQPDVFTEVSSSLPPLRILKAFCIETIDEIKEIDSPLSSLYVGLIKGVGRCASKAITELEKEKPDVRKILGDLRTCTFPIIKFFIHHPQNRQDYFMDATNRLNYAVKIMLTQFHGRYTDLEDPYWKVSFAQSKLPKKSEVISDEQ